MSRRDDYYEYHESKYELTFGDMMSRAGLHVCRYCGERITEENCSDAERICVYCADDLLKDGGRDG